MGKEKVGGPFTEQQVEDVKTVFRLVPLLLVATTVNIITMYIDFTAHLSQSKDQLLDDFLTYPVSVVNVETMIILLIHICVVFPFYHRHHPSMLKKIGIGCFACVTACAIFLVIDTTSHITSNRSIDCMYTYVTSTNSSQEHSLPLSRNLLHAPYFLQALAGVLVIPITQEFCFAQTPHSMKSLVFGIMIGWSELSLNFMVGVLKQIYATYLNYFPSCGFYYFATLFLVDAILSVLYCVLAKCYNFRVRQEIYHAHYVVERIYEDEFDRRDEEEAGCPDTYNTDDSEESYSTR